MNMYASGSDNDSDVSGSGFNRHLQEEELYENLDFYESEDSDFGVF